MCASGYDVTVADYRNDVRMRGKCSYYEQVVQDSTFFSGLLLDEVKDLFKIDSVLAVVYNVFVFSACTGDFLDCKCYRRCASVNLTMTSIFK